MFSKRISWDLETNALSQTLARKRAGSSPVWDLTASNPTRCGIPYPEADILDSLSAAAEAALLYAPSPKGLLSAREAVARYYSARGCEVGPESLVLTSSTSEAYGYLFKLLCDPGDEVLVPTPSYPLFGFLASLEGVAAHTYPLLAGDDWRIDFRALEKASSPRTRAVIAVHPNNPTGSFVHPDDRERLTELARERGLALIIDEVFLDFPLAASTTATTTAPPTSFARVDDDGKAGDEDDGLVFVLGGLSKLAGLPQMKLSWIAARGGGARRDEALLRLEHIADNYLSVSTLVQQAAPRLLEHAAGIRARISERTRASREMLEALAPREPSVTLLSVEGGWSQILRLPATETADAWALRFLDEASVYVHPGSFFGFASEAYVALSLLTESRVLETGTRELLAAVTRRLRG